MKFIDMHGHYAWNIDDGIPTLDEASMALKEAKSQGIKTIVATPHIYCGEMTIVDKDRIIDRLKELKELARSFDIEIKMGCELMLNDKVQKTLEANIHIPIENTDYLLCEDNVRRTDNHFIECFDMYVKEVLLFGLTPVIAHVERYFHEDIDLSYIRYLVELGCVIQVNSNNILGKGNPQHHKNAMMLLEEQLVDVIASDTHRATGKRSPNLRECYDYLLKKGYPRYYIDNMMYENPKRILLNTRVLHPKFIKRHKLKNMIFRKLKIIRLI